MPRLPRLTVPSYPHHIIQRGNNRQPIFFTEQDYSVFLDCLREAKRKCHARLYAYVLMTNHVHLLMEPEKDGDLGRFMQSVGRRYVRDINATYHRSGTLWEGRFRSAVVSRDEYLIVCSRYIELNPVRAGMVSHAGEYRWSSYRCRALGQPDDLVDDDPWYMSLGSSAEVRQRVYREWMDASVAEEEWTQIRRATQQGRVVGREEFQEEIGSRAGRQVMGENRGRPRKGAPVTENVL